MLYVITDQGIIYSGRVEEQQKIRYRVSYV